MVLKVFRLAWFLSVVVLFASLLYSYASWQQSLVIQEFSTNGGDQLTIEKDALFYLLVAAIALVNVLVYVVAKLYKPLEAFRAWFHGLIITINIFFIISIGLIAVYNSTDPYDFSRVGIFVYGSIALIALWGIAWPVYLLIQKIFVKEAV